jgi:Domain of unknown function (DUF4034)
MGGKWTGLLALTLTIGLIVSTRADASTFPRDTPVAEFCATVESELQKHQFEALDALAHELRDPEVRFIGGNSQLYEFYGVLGAFAGSPVFSCSSRLSFEDKQHLLEQWSAAKPKSLAAHIALGQLWWDAGWKERGDGYANSVGFFQWISLYSDLSKAKSILAQIDTGADPHGYYLLMEIAQSDAGWFSNPRTTLDALYSEGVKAYPTYYHFYSQRAVNLQERWYGQPGELPAYLASLANSPGGDTGLVAYSFIAYKLMQGTERSVLLRTTGLSWPLIQSGYAARERLYGLRNRDWNALCNLALAGIDRDAGKLALAHIGDNWDPAVWKERSYFDYAVGWINKAPN